VAGLRQNLHKDIYLRNGRVRAGYRIGEILSVQLVVNLIGERPGTGSNNLSAYMTYGHSREGVPRWGSITHAHTTALCSINRRIGVKPEAAARRIAKLIERMMTFKCSGVALLQYLSRETSVD
jgi:ethanolamine ammonia-lyase small subunit